MTTRHIRFAALLIGVVACMALKAQNGLTTEMYDFSTFTVNTLGLYNNNGSQADLSIGTTELFKVDGHSMYHILDFTSEKGTFPFNGRFAVEHKDAFKLRSGQAVSGVNKYVGFQARTAGMHYLSILNLAAGDKITMHCYDHRKLMQFLSDNVKDYPPGSSLVSGKATYTITKAGHVDMKIEQYAYIYSIKIETSNPEGSAPSPTFKMTGTNGTSRIITITRGLTAKDQDVATYYTTDGTEPTTQSNHFTTDQHTVIIGQGITRATKVRLKAMSVSGNGRKSPVSTSSEYTVGTLLSLAPVTIALTGFQADENGIYHPIYTFGNDNTQVAGSPDVAFTATFNNQPIQLANGQFTVDEPGILHAEAKADGYATTQATVSIRYATWAQRSATDFTSMTPASLNSADVGNKSEWRNAIQGKSVYGYQIQHDHNKLAPYMTLSNNNWGLFFADNALTECVGIASRWGAGEMQFALTDNQVALVQVALGGITNKPYVQQLDKGKNFKADQYVIVNGFEIYEPQTIPAAISSAEARPVSTRYHTLSGLSAQRDAARGIYVESTTLSDGRTLSRKVVLYK